jgi:hypothetical protein
MAQSFTVDVKGAYSNTEAHIIRAMALMHIEMYRQIMALKAGRPCDTPEDDQALATEAARFMNDAFPRPVKVSVEISLPWPPPR